MKKFLHLAVALAAVSVGSQAAVLFYDNFDSSLPVTTLNANVPGWMATNGAVDYVKSGSFAITCFGATGGCIDLDGSTGDAATPFETKSSFSFVTGRTYLLTFRLSGNQRGGAADTVQVNLGEISASIGPLIPTAGFAGYAYSFTATKMSSGTIQFSNAGGDNIGAILDEVKLEDVTKGGEVPEPSSLALLGAGVAALVGRRYLTRA